MAVAVDDIIQISIRGGLFSQRILTVLHYRITVAGSGSTDDNIQNIATDFAGGATAQQVMDNYMAAVAAQLVITEVRAQRVYPVRTVYKPVAVSRSGSQANDCTLSDIAMSIAKRTNRPGRHGIGRWQVAGLPFDAYVAGQLTDAYRTGAGSDLAQAMLVPWTTVTGTAISLTPTLYNPDVTPHFSDLVSASPEDTVRTMHRRTVRVGE